MTEKLLHEFITDIITHLDENTKKLKTCLDELEETDVWKRPNEHSNSVGNLILHLSGNIRQWIISALGGEEDIRERDKEFSADGGFLPLAGEPPSVMHSHDISLKREISR